jgi:hypothetical protein
MTSVEVARVQLPIPPVSVHSSDGRQLQVGVPLHAAGTSTQ